MSRKHRMIGLGSLAVLVGAVVIYINFFARPTHDGSETEAAKAATEIAQRQGGGEQARNAEGVPMDAVIDPKDRENSRREKGFGGK